MKKLKDIQDRYLNSDLKATEALKEIFDTYLISDYELKLHGLKIVYVDYGVNKLYQNDDYITEGERTDMLERAREIINKHSMDKPKKVEYCNKYKWQDCECKDECRRGLRIK